MVSRFERFSATQITFQKALSYGFIVTRYSFLSDAEQSLQCLHYVTISKCVNRETFREVEFTSVPHSKIRAQQENRRRRKDENSNIHQHSDTIDIDPVNKI